MAIFELIITLKKLDLELDDVEQIVNTLFNQIRNFYDELDKDIDKIQLVPESILNHYSLEQKGSGYLPIVKIESENLNEVEKNIEYIQEQLPHKKLKLEFTISFSGDKTVKFEGSPDELSPERIKEYLEIFNIT